MSENFRDSFDPYKEMRAFYGVDDPTEEQQFRFVESMKYLIDTAFLEDDVIAFSYNLAKYYLDIREYELAKKYFEIGAHHGSNSSKEGLGLIWYYGLAGEQDYEKAYRYFEECKTRKGMLMIADMYHDGSYVRRDIGKCREIIEALFERADEERRDPCFFVSTLFPEVALRLVKLNHEERKDSLRNLDRLVDARKILTIRQQNSPFWGNIGTMRSILKTTVELAGNDCGFIDLYDLLTFDTENASLSFKYDGAVYRLDIFRHEGEIIYQFGDKWFHGAKGFLEKARIDGKRITTVINLITSIKEC